MLRLALSLTSTLLISGCSGKQIICETWGEAQCPKPLKEVEASNFFKPSGVITKSVTTCIGTIEENASNYFEGFGCISDDFYK